MNSIVVLWNGGYDKDSRYIPRADSTDPHLRASDGSLATGPVVEAAGRVGSPIGFRSLVATRLTPVGPQEPSGADLDLPGLRARVGLPFPAHGRLLAHVRRRERPMPWPAPRTPTAAWTTSVDGPGGAGRRRGQPGGTDAERALRRKVLVFYVDKAPALVRDPSPTFLPYEGQSITTSCGTSSCVAWTSTRSTPPGESSGRRSHPEDDPPLQGHALRQEPRGSRHLLDLSRADRPALHPALGADVALSFVPGGTMATNPFASGPIKVSIQICDCIDCETCAGAGALRRWHRPPDRDGS